MEFEKRPFLKRKQGRLIVYVLLAYLIDIFGKNGFLLFDQSADEYKMYWICQSISFLGYITCLWLLARYIYYIIATKETLALKLITFNFIPFAIQDLLDECFNHASDFYLLEYLAVPIAVWFTIKEVKQKWKSI